MLKFQPLPPLNQGAGGFLRYISLVWRFAIKPEKFFAPFFHTAKIPNKKLLQILQELMNLAQVRSEVYHNEKNYGL